MGNPSTLKVVDKLERTKINGRIGLVHELID